MTGLAEDRAALVEAARDTIAAGSQSFASASRLLDPLTRERAWLLYAWCRAADDLTDGQTLGHAAAQTEEPDDPLERHRQLTCLTLAALDGEEEVPLPFEALRKVVREASIPRHFVEDHLAGFALDATNWRPAETEDLLRYCYHVAGVVGCMMALVMGVDPSDEDTLDRASDQGIAFQLANIARDLVTDARAGRCYVPASWMSEFGLTEAAVADSANRTRLAEIANRLIEMARPYRSSARAGADRLPPRSRLSILAADAVYGAIGEKVVLLGERAWDERVYIPKSVKLALFVRSLLSSFGKSAPVPRTSLWTRARHSA